ncbi:MAG: DUF5664 domain-containing protein [Bacillota bacterium]|nr:DUF5664 domain-containing protein [Bacillota bacterium]
MSALDKMQENLRKGARDFQASMAKVFNVPIADSGTRREFETGAVRDMAEGKGRCDLMPLLDIGWTIDDEVLRLIGEFVEAGSGIDLECAIKEFISKGQSVDVYQTLMELSVYYEKGVEKYGERNWEKGIPLHTYIDSGVRHYLKHQTGQEDERHDLAFLWNMFGALWTLRNRPEMVDLPFKDLEVKANGTNNS